MASENLEEFTRASNRVDPQGFYYLTPDKLLDILALGVDIQESDEASLFGISVLVPALVDVILRLEKLEGKNLYEH